MLKAAQQTLRPNRLVVAQRLATRSIWGVAPEESQDSLLVPLDVSSPVPLVDGATPTKVRRGAERQRATLPSASAQSALMLPASLATGVRHALGLARVLRRGVRA